MSSNVELIKTNFINNGEYQKIVWLGVHGFLIINEWNKEILIIDPWPSYSKETIKDSVKINQLIDWLFNAYKNGYKLIGIIGTHEHYDHIADIPTILYKLYRNDKILLGDLPPLYADRGTFEEIEKRYTWIFGLPMDREGKPCSFEDMSSYNEISLPNTPLYYDDENQSAKEDDGVENYPLIAGTKLTEITIGNYSITPYIWDHVSSSPYFDDLRGDKSGNYQRCTAIFLKHKNDPDKSLFIIGSAGEMSPERTGDGNLVTRLVTDGNRLVTDMLIQAAPHEIVTDDNYEDTLQDLIDYQIENITVKDMIIASHFETFVDIHVPLKLIGLLTIFIAPLLSFMPSLPVAGTVLTCVDDVVKEISCFDGDLEKYENKKRIKNYADCLFGSQIKPDGSQINPDNKINKIHYMNRFFIEYGFQIIEEKDDGYLIHDESILEHTSSPPNPFDQVFETETHGYNIFAIQRNSILLFNARYLANPHTKEVHDLKKSSIIYRGNKMYYELPHCNIYRMNFRDMKHFETKDEAFKIIDGATSKPYNGCAHCMPFEDTD